MVIARVIIFLTFALGLSTFGYAVPAHEEISPDRPLSAAERLEVETFSSYHALLSQVLKSFIDGSSLTDSQAQTLKEKLKGCEFKSDTFEQTVENSISGENCGIQYEGEWKYEDHGLNEMGDPVYEIISEENFLVKDEALLPQIGLSSFRASGRTRYETLVSTPVELRAAHLQIHFLTAAGKEVLARSHTRFYTNLETQEDTYFRRQVLRFEGFDVRFDITAELTSEGYPKQSHAKLNQQPSDLDELLSLFKPVFVGLEVDW